MIVEYDKIKDFGKLGWKINNLLEIRDYFNIPKWFIITDKKDLKKFDIKKVYEQYLNTQFYICRSSMSNEDSKKLSYAWLFESIEWNIGNWWLEEDIGEVFESINNNFLDKYEKNIIGHIIKNRKMNVLVQEFILWDVSWVYFSKFDRDKKIIEYIKWCNQFLVDWIVKSNKIILNNKFEIKNHEKNKQYKYIWENLDIFIYEKINNSLNEKVLEKLLIELKKLENFFDFDIDVEWTIKDWKVYILQVRPITVS